MCKFYFETEKGGETTPCVKIFQFSQNLQLFGMHLKLKAT